MIPRLCGGGGPTSTSSPAAAGRSASRSSGPPRGVDEREAARELFAAVSEFLQFHGFLSTLEVVDSHRPLPASSAPLAFLPSLSVCKARTKSTTFSPLYFSQPAPLCRPSCLTGSLRPPLCRPSLWRSRLGTKGEQPAPHNLKGKMPCAPQPSWCDLDAPAPIVWASQGEPITSWRACVSPGVTFDTFFSGLPFFRLILPCLLSRQVRDPAGLSKRKGPSFWPVSPLETPPSIPSSSWSALMPAGARSSLPCGSDTSRLPCWHAI